jgi:ankyrin repeat protein
MQTSHLSFGTRSTNYLHPTTAAFQRNPIPTTQPVKDSLNISPHFSAKNDMHRWVNDKNYTKLEQFLTTGDKTEIANMMVEKDEVTGNTPLHLAVLSNLTKFRDLLLSHGSPTNIKNKSHKTAKEIMDMTSPKQSSDVIIGPSIPPKQDQVKKGFWPGGIVIRY